MIYFGQKQLINVQFLDFRVIGSRFVKFLTSILNWQVNSFSNFASFFIAIIHNFPVHFKLIHFLLWIKGPIKVPILRISSSLVKICQLFMPFSKPQIKFSSNWKITSLYFFRSYFASLFSVMRVNSLKFFTLMSSFCQNHIKW